MPRPFKIWVQPNMSIVQSELWLSSFTSAWGGRKSTLHCCLIAGQTHLILWLRQGLWSEFLSKAWISQDTGFKVSSFKWAKICSITPPSFIWIQGTYLSLVHVRRRSYQCPYSCWILVIPADSSGISMDSTSQKIILATGIVSFQYLHQRQTVRQLNVNCP